MIDRIIRLRMLAIVWIILLPAVGLSTEPLPPRALARIGDYRFYHGPDLISAVLSPDGLHIASVAYDLSFDDERAAYGKTIYLWDAATGERLREMCTPKAGIRCLEFSPDGKRLAADYDTSDEDSAVAIFEVDTGKLQRRLERFKRSIGYLHFSSDGKRLYVGELERSVSAWDTVTGKQIKLWKSPQESSSDEDRKKPCGVYGVVSPDGKVVVWEMGTKDRGPLWETVGLRVHDAVTDKLLYQKRFNLHYPLSAISFSHDSKRFATSADKFFVWETATGKELASRDVPKTQISLFGREDEVALPHQHGFVLSPDGRRAAICEWGIRLRSWDLQTGKLSSGTIVRRSDLFSGSHVFSASGNTLLAATDSTLRLYDMETLTERPFAGHRAPVVPRFAADGRILFTSCDERRCRWDVSRNPPTLLKHEPRNVWEIDAMAYSSDDRLFLDESGKCVRVRETATGRVVRQLKWANPSWDCLFSPDTARVMLWNHNENNPPKQIQLYQLKTGKASNAIKAPDLLDSPLFSPNGQFIAWATSSNAIHVHDAATGKTVRILTASRSFSGAKCDEAHLLFSPDSERIFIAAYIYGKSDTESYTALPIRVFQISSGRECACFHANPKEMSKAGVLSCMDCSPDGRLLAVAEQHSGFVRVLEIASGKTRVEFAGHRYGVHSLAFSPDGTTLVSGGEDDVVFLWDVTGGRMPAKKTHQDRKPMGLWNDLASDDGKRAGDAIAALIHTPDRSVAFLQQGLHPAEEIDEKRLAGWIAGLDADAFATREAATRALFQLEERAEAVLRHTLKTRPTLEVRKRIEHLLQQIESGQVSSETLRTLRAIEVLEHIGSPAAQDCLAALAKGAPGARTTREAKWALHRLAERK